MISVTDCGKMDLDTKTYWTLPFRGEYMSFTHPTIDRGLAGSGPPQEWAPVAGGGGRVHHMILPKFPKNLHEIQKI